MDGRYEEARLETKAATLAERLVVEWPLQASLEAGPPLLRAQLAARFVPADRWQTSMTEVLGYKLCYSLCVRTNRRTNKAYSPFLDNPLFCVALKFFGQLDSHQRFGTGKVGFSLTFWAILPIGIKSHVNVAVSPTYQCATAVTGDSSLYPVI